MEKEVKRFLKGTISTDKETIIRYSRDASIFEIFPKAVIFPKNILDIKKLVNYVKKHKNLSLTPRTAGTDMSGGPLTESLVLDLKHFNKIKRFSSNKITVQPGVFYRDFEKQTLKRSLILPSFPASKELCAIGGMVANNSGGEKSLKYGKTIDYVTKLKVILSDGNEYTLKPLNKQELNKKTKQKNFEGKFYKEIYSILNQNYSLIKEAKPDVSKNSSGYNLWDIWDKKVFDLTKLFVGSQGTLGVITEMTFKLVKLKKHTGMVIIFLKDLDKVISIVNTVLPFKPTSFESFDDKSFNLALKFFPEFLKLMETKNLISLSLNFIPEFFHVLINGVPKLTLLVEFDEDSQEEVNKKIIALRTSLNKFNVKTKGFSNKNKIKKYWLIRRESFNLLRNKVKGKQSAPFIDDFIVKPEKLEEIFQKLTKILDNNKLDYTIIGHIGDGNFHIIPLMVLKDGSERKKIPKISNQVYNLVISLNGSITAEHNDGLIRSPYLRKMYGDKIYKLFKQVKMIFDPNNIFNPGKKVNSSLDYAIKHIKKD